MDSPVAAYHMMKRGAHVVLVHFQNHLQMQSAVQDKIVRIAAQLTRYQDHLHLYMVPFAELQAEIIERVPANERARPPLLSHLSHLPPISHIVT